MMRRNFVSRLLCKLKLKKPKTLSQKLLFIPTLMEKPNHILQSFIGPLVSHLISAHMPVILSFPGIYEEMVQPMVNMTTQAN